MEGGVILDKTRRACERVHSQWEHHEGLRRCCKLAPKPVLIGPNEAKLGVISRMPKDNHDSLTSGVAGGKSCGD